jgi:hypothetical protein
MTTLNVMGPASFHYAPYGEQLEQQQSSSCPSVQEQYIPEDTEFIQPFGPIAISPCEFDNSYIYDDYLELADPCGTLLHEQLPALPNPNVIEQIVPPVTDASSRTAYSTEYSSDTNAELDLLSDLNLPAALLSQSSPFSPEPGPSALPEQQEIHFAPSRVSNSPSLRVLHIMWIYVRMEF